MYVKPERNPKTLRSISGYQRSTIKLNRIASRLNQQADRRGRNSESKVDQALQKLKEEGEIAGFYRRKRLDRQGVDRVIVTFVGKIPLQIKSSNFGLAKHTLQTQTKGGHIPAIAILSGEEIDSVKSKILNILETIAGN